MLLESSGMLLAEVAGMLSRLASMLPVSKGMLSPAGMLFLVGMLLAEVAGVLPLRGMLPASVSARLKNSASAAFTSAEYIKPFLLTKSN